MTEAQLEACEKEKAALQVRAGRLQRQLQSVTDELERREGEVQGLRRQLEGLHRQLEGLQGNVDVLTRELESLSRKKRQRETENEVAYDAKVALLARVSELERQLARCQAELAQRQEAERRRSLGGSHAAEQQQQQQVPPPAGGVAEGAALVELAAVGPAPGEAWLNVEMMNVRIGLRLLCGVQTSNALAMFSSQLWLEPSCAGIVVPAVSGGSGASGGGPSSAPGEGRIERFRAPNGV